MIKINLHKIKFIAIRVVIIGCIVFTYAFVSISHQNTTCKNITVKFLNKNENCFLNEKMILELVETKNDSLKTSKIKNLNVYDLEQTLNSNPYIEKSNVFVKINGDIVIETLQKNPIARVYSSNGDNYYIDSTSTVLFPNDNYTPRVMIVSGNLYEPYTHRNFTTIKEIKLNPTANRISMLDDVYEMSMHIQNDSTLKKIIHQIYIDLNNDLILYPAIGSHKIIFGSIENMAEKFLNLKLFYTQGLNKTDNWQTYSVINLKFKNQIVCNKKESI